MRIRFNKRGFTLAEIMIVLMVIGIITAVLLPVARHATPDENVLKFKKANATLGNVIRELVTSDKYYLDGDLGMKPDGAQVYNKPETTKYFCETIAELVNTKSVNCSDNTGGVPYVAINSSTLGQRYTVADATDETIQTAKTKLDTACKTYAKDRGKEIELTDGTVFYKPTAAAFGSVDYIEPDGTTTTLRYFSPPGQFPANHADTQGIDMVYMPFCVDIDGFDESKGSADCDDIKDICPFGYGIRADGKILYGARAQEWIEKSIQGKD